MDVTVTDAAGSLVIDTAATLGSSASVQTFADAQRSAAAALLAADDPPKMPWEMPYDERRRASKDPRIIKQIAEEDQWSGTICSGIWRRVRVFALPRNDWLMSRDVFVQLLSSHGVNSPQLQQKLFLIFDAHRSGSVNGLVMTKHIHLALTTQPLSELFTRHCFECFDRVVGTEYISIELLNKCKLLTPEEIAASLSKKKGKKSRGSGSPDTSPDGRRREAMSCGARYANVEGLKALVAASASEETLPSPSPATSAAVISSSPTDTTSSARRSPALPSPVGTVDFALFRSFFLDSKNGEWIGSFFLQILECCAKYFVSPEGELRLPLIPLRWLQSVQPLPATTEMYDADVVVLREIEATGVDPTKVEKKKKGKSRSASPKKKKK